MKISIRVASADLLSSVTTSVQAFVRDGWTSCGYRYKQIDGSKDISVFVAKTRAGNITAYAERK